MNYHWCPDCGWSGMAPETVAVLFHPCRPPLGHRRRRVQIPADSREERLAEARGQVFHSIEEALGERALRGGVDE